MLLSLKKFKYIILDQHVTVLTDSKNILYDTPITNSRLQRWRIMLSEYNITIKHIKGEDNHIPDLISRANVIKQHKENFTYPELILKNSLYPQVLK